MTENRKLYVAGNHNPLMRSLVDRLRDTHTDAALFRRTAEEITRQLLYEAARKLPYKEEEQPHWTGAPYPGKRLDEEQICFFAILRAGEGMVAGALGLAPGATIYHLGMCRDEDTAQAQWYYKKLPESLDGKTAVILDPMLATGGSLIEAYKVIKPLHPERILALTIVSAPEGVAKVKLKTRGMIVYTGSLDDHLNEKKYIIPGLGDAGDRLFGTS